MGHSFSSILMRIHTSHVIKLLNSFGITSREIKDTGAVLIVPTICHNEEVGKASPKLYYYKDTKKFYCYTNCKSMSLVDFLTNVYQTRHENISFQKAVDILRELVDDKSEGFTIISQPVVSKKNILDKDWEKSFSTFNKNILQCFTQAPKYLEVWMKEGIDYEVLLDFEVSFDLRKNRIVFPAYNHVGSLVGIKTRNFNQEDLEEHRKYMPLWHNNTLYNYPKLMVVYGAYQNRRIIKKAKQAVVFEAEKSVLQFGSMFSQNRAVAVGGSVFSVYHGHILKNLRVESIVLAFDNDWGDDGNKNFGLERAIKEAERIQEMGFEVEIVYDFEHNLLNNKDSPVDQGRAVYSKLYRSRKTLKELLVKEGNVDEMHN